MITEIAGMVAGVKGMIDTGKFLVDANRQLGEAEWKMKIVELMSKMVELKAELIELQQKLSDKESVEFKDGMYWHRGEASPYCQLCFDDLGKLIHLQDYESSWHCFNCKLSVEKSNQQKPPTPMGPMAF